jgi:hypothetical protein
MAKAILREMLGLAKKRPELKVVSSEGVRNVTPQRQESVRMRPLERRRAMGTRHTG